MFASTLAPCIWLLDLYLDLHPKCRDIINSSMGEEADPTYKVKFIDFHDRKVPIILQNENGPCPLLAIANVLLLRNNIQLPNKSPDVSQVSDLPRFGFHMIGRF